MRDYKCLVQQQFKNGEFELIPIRMEDRFQIMKWRNEQMYHLRQNEILTEEKQTAYFDNVVSKLFETETPNQILFSFLKNKELIGYGGLVHINWIDKNAEISLVLNTKFDVVSFKELWKVYLSMIKFVSFKHLKFRKIFTYAFDIRPFLYDALEDSGFVREAVLKDHCIVDGKYKNVIIHSFWNPICIEIRSVTENDCDLLFKWANEFEVRKNSINTDKIFKENHNYWFKNKLSSKDTKIFIIECKNSPVGQIRFDKINNIWNIDYSVDKNYRNLGLGKLILESGLLKMGSGEFFAQVKRSNIQSISIFQSLGFKTPEIDHFDDNKKLINFIKKV